MNAIHATVQGGSIVARSAAPIYARRVMRPLPTLDVEPGLQILGQTWGKSLTNRHGVIAYVPEEYAEEIARRLNTYDRLLETLESMVPKMQHEGSIFNKNECRDDCPACIAAEAIEFATKDN